MKIDEIVNAFKSANDCMVFDDDGFTIASIDGNELDSIANALGKQIYKKPVIVDWQPVCPTCGGFLVVGCGCPKNGCGQSIDWGAK